VTFRTRLTTAFVVVVVVPLLVVLAVVATLLPKALEQVEERGLRDSSALVAQLVESRCDRARAAAQVAARAASATTGADDPSLPAVLDELVRRTLADGVRVTRPGGTTAAWAGAAPDVPERDCTAGRPTVTGELVQITAIVRLDQQGVAAQPPGAAAASFTVDQALAIELGELAGGGRGGAAGRRPAGGRQRDHPSLAARAGRRAGHDPGQDPAGCRPGRRPRARRPGAAGRGAGRRARSRRSQLPAARARDHGRGPGDGCRHRGAGGPRDDPPARGAGCCRRAGRGRRPAHHDRGPLARRAGTAGDLLQHDDRGAAPLRRRPEDSRNELQAGVARIGDALAGTHDVDRIVAVVLDTAVAATRARAGAVWLVGGGGSALELAVHDGFAKQALLRPPSSPSGSGVAGRVARTGEPLRGRQGVGDLLPARGSRPRTCCWSCRCAAPAG
jgi:hypothetical protein